jgi:dihydrofolate reductase
MELNIIAGMTEQRIIGNNGKLPWHIPEDLKLFKKITEGNTVLMGRKTYNSLPDTKRPLPKRNNIVISKNINPYLDFRTMFCYNIGEGLKTAENYEKPTFVIGGASIYEQTLPIADKLYISHIKRPCIGDTFFPEVDFINDWEIEKEKDYRDFIFRIYKRSNKN